MGRGFARAKMACSGQKPILKSPKWPRYQRTLGGNAKFKAVPKPNYLKKNMRHGVCTLPKKIWGIHYVDFLVNETLCVFLGFAFSDRNASPPWKNGPGRNVMVAL